MRSTLLRKPSRLLPYHTIAGIEALFCFLSEALSSAELIPILIRSPIWEAENNALIPADPSLFSFLLRVLLNAMIRSTFTHLHNRSASREAAELQAEDALLLG